MAITQEVRALVSKIDEATNQIAARIQILTDKIGSGISAADAEEIKTGLQAEVDRLGVLGSDPENPVPALGRKL